MDFLIFHKSRQEIEDIQFRKIKKIVEYAFKHSAYYHQLYVSRGFEPAMLRSYADIQKIPVVKRIGLKNTPCEQIVTDKNFQKLHSHTTSGSSGIPVHFYYNDRELLLKNYGVMRAYFKMGMRMRDVTVAIRDPIDIRKPGLYEKLHIMAYDYYNTYDPVAGTYAAICDKYAKIDILKGMPSDLMNLAYAVRNGERKFPPVRLLISDCEVLDEFSRQYISQTFGTSVLDYYASVENGCIAFQLPGSSKYFVNEDQVLLENGSGDGPIGDAIITNLRNTTFPIIRYQIGDMIDFGDGKSDLPGIHLKTIDQIYGKYLDFIVLPDDTIISPHMPKQEMTHLSGIRKFQIIQDQIDHITVHIEKDTDYTDETENEIRQRMNRCFKGLIRCDIHYDEQLSKKTSRKFKVIQSMVAQEFLSDSRK